MTAARTKAEAKARLAELVLYVGAKCARHEHYGVLKLNKILFYSDFRAYRVLGEPITGVEYRKYEHGPAPAIMGPLRLALQRAGHAFEYMNPLHCILNDDGEEMSEKQLLPKRKPNMELFTREQIMLVDEVIQQLRPLTGQEVSRMSHEHPGWRLAAMDEKIPYCAELLPKQPRLISAKARKWALQVARKFEDRGASEVPPQAEA
jgi:hypothetical protein